MPENIQKIIKNILRDIQVELTDEFEFKTVWVQVVFEPLPSIICLSM
jgi:hypothetical protein